MHSSFFPGLYVVFICTFRSYITYNLTYVRGVPVITHDLLLLLFLHFFLHFYKFKNHFLAHL